MPIQLIPLFLLTLRALCASAAPPPPGIPGPPGENGPALVGHAIPPTVSMADWPTSTETEWMSASPCTSSLVTSAVTSVCSTTTTTTSVTAFSTTVSYSNGTTRSLSSCSASMNEIIPSAFRSDFKGTIRRYYVAAEEIEWDYAPSGWDNWLGVPLNDSVRAKKAGYLEYGTVWTKALYRGYTDATFSQRTEQPAWQGTQGPIIRAEVGDLIEILFVNNLTKHYATMHSMGLAYEKSSEGADYPDAEPGVNFEIPEEDAVPPVEPGVAPGGCVVYKWMVTELAGPDYGEPARIHSYHSYVSLYEDANAGLIGPTVIYAKGTMDAVMSGYREIPFLFMIYAESTSFLSGVNAEKLTNQTIEADVTQLYSANSSVWYPQELNIAGAEHFSSAPAFHAINGYTFSNNPVFEMCQGDKVLWYVMAYGSGSHVFHMHGNGYKYANAGQYATSINDGVGKTFVMDATGAGLWQVICHVDHHLSRGMVANYKVYSKNCPLEPLASSSS